MKIKFAFQIATVALALNKSLEQLEQDLVD